MVSIMWRTWWLWNKRSLADDGSLWSSLTMSRSSRSTSSWADRVTSRSVDDIFAFFWPTETGPKSENLQLGFRALSLLERGLLNGELSGTKRNVEIWDLRLSYIYWNFFFFRWIDYNIRYLNLVILRFYLVLKSNYNSIVFFILVFVIF